MASTDPKKLKRKGSADAWNEVDESKKAKQDALSKELKVEMPHEAVKSDPDVLKYLQIIIAGPRKCGKSCLVSSYMGQSFPSSKVEFLSKQYLHILPNNQQVMIWDLDSRVEFTGYRHKSYPEADVALLCFDIKKPIYLREKKERDILRNLLLPWYTELVEHCKDIPIILVGLKGDLKMLSDEIFFSDEERSYAMRRLPRIKLYREVSAIAKKGVDDLFSLAINSIDKPKPKLMLSNCGFRFLAHRWLV